LFAAIVLVSSCGGGTPEPAADTGTGAVVTSSATKLGAAIRALRPKPVVVNYWATWCEPCKKEMPRLVEAAARYRRRVGFVGVNVEDDRSSARAFAKEYQMPFRSHAMSRAEVERTQDILGLPVTQFYSADGELAFVHQGEISEDDLEEKIRELLRVGSPVDEPQDGA
jgi:thiol-disulfide isomerase/thioredoxin